MALIGLLLGCIVILLLLALYTRILYNCKCGVRIIADSINNNDNDKTIENLQQAPGPIPWPVLGNLALLGQYAVPFEGFSALSKVYGDVYSLTLGTTRCVVVNSLELIKEVLNQNGKYFGGRPNFEVRTFHSTSPFWA